MTIIFYTPTLPLSYTPTLPPVTRRPSPLNASLTPLATTRGTPATQWLLNGGHLRT
ncbi:hypothetical protein [Gloeocapsopsis sp. IPPAS B-1203]|uniref:hypothetical protein n=1 Tax=Gloeocapsopsis sp. IPPAS B-1203 TaxID=2049454 RepID=UPI0025A071D4|nr:hypothetical protein [Gloeocapsopsis sp. IPPAS B-1203]